MRPAGDPVVCLQQCPPLTAAPVAPRRSSWLLPLHRDTSRGFWLGQDFSRVEAEGDRNVARGSAGLRVPFMVPAVPVLPTCEPAPTSPRCLPPLGTAVCARARVRTCVSACLCACVYVCARHGSRVQQAPLHPGSCEAPKPSPYTLGEGRTPRYTGVHTPHMCTRGRTHHTHAHTTRWSERTALPDQGPTLGQGSCHPRCGLLWGGHCEVYVWGPPKCQVVSAPPGAPARCAGTAQTVWSSTVSPEPRKLGGGSQSPSSPPHLAFPTDGSPREPAQALDLPCLTQAWSGESPHTLTSAWPSGQETRSIRRVRPRAGPLLYQERCISGRGGLRWLRPPHEISEQPPSLPQWAANILVLSEGPPPARAELGRPGTI
ncbi:uncharacterized protein LOC132012439 [Mustela nigripes]|uniref:uncharacterized protein LOC132012439 n=1 Tax=Mustela nigripes TaxID=77151 RepID=UPI00281628BD|nr:uncharacterized protein LOC132012439 [Mustela nigripes]